MVKSGNHISNLFNRCQEVWVATPISNPKRSLILDVRLANSVHTVAVKLGCQNFSCINKTFHL